MTTKIRPVLSKKNKYYVEKHRYYELKHFCMQYGEWKRLYLDLERYGVNSTSIIDTNDHLYFGRSSVEIVAKKKLKLSNKIELVKDACKRADSELWNYILMGVTENCTYEQLQFRYGIPCCRDTYYERYRRFFYILDKLKD